MERTGRERPKFPEEWLVAVLDCLDEGVIALTDDGEVVAANPSAERLLGFSIAEDRYRPFHELGISFVDESGHPIGPGEDPVSEALATGERMDPTTVGIPSGDGRMRWLRFTCHPLPVEASGSRTDIVVVFSDVTDQVVAERAKREFLAMTSHELRTPLHALLGYGDLLQSGDLRDEDHDRYLDAMMRQGRTVLRLVDDLLVAARLGSGKLSAVPDVVDVAEVTHQVVDDLHAADQVEIDIGDDVNVVADPDHVRRIVLNLVENAMRYGAPPIEVRARHEGEDGVVVVADRGPGIPAEFEPRLFEAFSQGADRPGRGGTGLGLAIVDGLAQLNGGSVSYAPNEPTGARFTVRLPADPEVTSSGQSR